MAEVSASFRVVPVEVEGPVAGERPFVAEGAAAPAGPPFARPVGGPGVAGLVADGRLAVELPDVVEAPPAAGASHRVPWATHARELLDGVRADLVVGVLRRVGLLVLDGVRLVRVARWGW
ncbi:hypothetical protein MF672_017305 [Actinomadura sp. ATCC 31491]|uniref:Uncharacterized protein n=1 Tax=Actinomadura luzonensis TaxID=2805427 RepID=A0ABT0FT69_9ACTN|nr:hypothetical protein [Actinomadura luzonensis]MCK2215530.1 hypothetical protein [Actinomadura luzonensis]